MRGTRLRLFLVAVLAMTGAAREPAAAPELDLQRFRELHAQLQVDRAAEPWRRAGWRTDLGSARREAAAAGRPLFLWAMNGHPLGCT